MTWKTTIARAAGVISLVPAIGLLMIALAIGASWSGLAYTVGLLVAALGLTMAGARGRRRYTARAGLGLIALTSITRACSGAAGETMTMTGADGTSSARLLGRVMDEGDVAVTATYALSWSRLLDDPERDHLPIRMRESYAKMRKAEGDSPSPLLPTYAALQRAGAFDVLVIDGLAAPEGALVFLHGFAGSFTLPCWQIAQAARAANLITLCPATGLRGDWWSKDGEAALRRTLAIAHDRGLDRVWLAGLSNGGVGAGVLAPKLRGALRGVILISGANPAAPAPGIPALVIAGRGDRMCPPSITRAWAQKAGARYVELEGGHFTMLTHEEEATRAITSWLRRSSASSPDRARADTARP